MESKQNETFGSVIFGTNMIQRTWSASQEAVEAAMRVEGAPTPTGRAPCLVGPSSIHQPTSSSYIYPRTLKPSGSTTKNFSTTATFCTREIPSEALFGDLPKGESITEGFYINTIASPMMCE